MSGFKRARLVAEVTEPEDTTAALSISLVDDELVHLHLCLSSTQLRELAADLMERADYLDRVPGRNRKTPAWHHRNGVRLLAESDREDAPSGPPPAPNRPPPTSRLPCPSSPRPGAAPTRPGRTSRREHRHHDRRLPVHPATAL
ncbi:MAG: hypothetical protein ABIQ18_38295 [Umezawaea sp.]